MLPKAYRESIIWFNIWCAAKFRRPGVPPTNSDDSPDEFDIGVTNSSVRSTGGAGHIMLNDESEVSTDDEDGESDDEESDDEEPGKEEQNDDGALERIAATENRDEGEKMKDESKPEKGEESKETDISSNIRGINLESTDQKGESTTAK